MTRSPAGARRTAGRRLVPLVLDDPSEVLMGKEPVLVDGRTAGYVTSAAFGYTLGRVDRLRVGAGRGRDPRHGASRSSPSDAAGRDRRRGPAIRPGDAEAAGMTATTAADPRTATILDAIGETPLVRIDDIWVKLEFLNPSGSVKARIARYMIERAEREGRLRPGDTIVEASSGNTGNAMSMVAAVKGYRMLVVMPDGMSPERLAISRAFGAEVLTLGDFHVTQALEKARELGTQPGHFSPQQFNSEWNVDENREWLGPRAAPPAAGRGRPGRHRRRRRDGRDADRGRPGASAQSTRAWPVIGVEPNESCTLMCGEVGKHLIEGISDGFIPGSSSATAT